MTWTPEAAAKQMFTQVMDGPSGEAIRSRATQGHTEIAALPFTETDQNVSLAQLVLMWHIHENTNIHHQHLADDSDRVEQLILLILKNDGIVLERESKEQMGKFLSIFGGMILDNIGLAPAV
jgi:hypothetical protein